VTSYREYAEHFGGVSGDAVFVSCAIDGFFQNGGKRLFVCRLVGKRALAACARFGNFVVTAVGPGSWGGRIWVRIDPEVETKAPAPSTPQAARVRIRVAYWQELPDIGLFDPFDVPTNEQHRRRFPPTLTEDFRGLEPHPAEAIDSPLAACSEVVRSTLVVLRASSAAASDERPAAVSRPLGGGVDDPDGLDDSDFEGEPAAQRNQLQGFAALETDACREVDLVYAPAASASVARVLIAHCERVRYRFAVIDAPPEVSTPADMQPRVSVGDTDRGAYYFPWIWVADPRSGAHVRVPSGGHVLGVYARVDNERGVFKAPANEIVRGALAVTVDVGDRLQATLAASGVNAIRSFPDRGIRIWGARTLSSNASWRYVGVRRLLLFLERSIDDGIGWVVFEPNDPGLWARVREAIRLFLSLQWRGGALFGSTEKDAFYVICDETTMTQADIQQGRLVCQVGVAPVRPGEFVQLRIARYTADVPS
jgi:hypothetical protein